METATRDRWRWVPWVASIGGLCLVVYALTGDTVDLHATALEMGAALALVGVLAFVEWAIERRFRREVRDAVGGVRGEVEQVASDIDALREQVSTLRPASAGAAQANSTARALADEFRADPTPARLLALAQYSGEWAAGTAVNFQVGPRTFTTLPGGDEGVAVRIGGVGQTHWYKDQDYASFVASLMQFWVTHAQDFIGPEALDEADLVTLMSDAYCRAIDRQINPPR